MEQRRFAEGVRAVGIFDRFQESPFGPLNEHMQRVKECVALVRPMFEFVRDENFDGLGALTMQVFKTEHEADKIKTEIRRRIPRSFYLPIYRGDLLAYLKLQDDMADTVEDLAVLLTLKRLRMPAALVDSIMELVNRVLSTCDLLFQCTDQLANLVESDFSGRRSQEILEFVAQAEHAEWRADKAQFVVSQQLFQLEDELRATDIMLWSNVFVVLGKLANTADNAAERLRRMLAR